MEREQVASLHGKDVTIYTKGGHTFHGVLDYVQGCDEFVLTSPDREVTHVFRVSVEAFSCKD
jgi:hypothetical protein